MKHLHVALALNKQLAVAEAGWATAFESPELSLLSVYRMPPLDEIIIPRLQ